MTIDDFKIYESAPPTMHPNRMLIPVNNFGFNDAGVKQFNEIYRYCLEAEAAGKMTPFKLTSSGGFDYKIGNLRGAKWQLVTSRTMIEIAIRNFDARYYRFQIGYRKDEKKKLKMISGRKAFTIYCRQLKNDGVNITDYAISPEEGLRVKALIPKPLICLVKAVPERTYHNAFHIDINSAYSAGIIEQFPEFERTVRFMYNSRKKHPIYKDVLNMATGFFQSNIINYKYSHICKAGHDYTHREIGRLSDALTKEGFRILSYNTDGIWCQSLDGTVYHDDHEGDDIGQWKRDRTDCKIRFKSEGCYEYEGLELNSGKWEYTYCPILRGVSSLERIKPRSEWIWGDIFKGAEEKYVFIEGEGIKLDEDII